MMSTGFVISSGPISVSSSLPQSVSRTSSAKINRPESRRTSSSSFSRTPCSTDESGSFTRFTSSFSEAEGSNILVFPNTGSHAFRSRTSVPGVPFGDSESSFRPSGPGNPERKEGFAASLADSPSGARATRPLRTRSGMLSKAFSSTELQEQPALQERAATPDQLKVRPIAEFEVASVLTPCSLLYSLFACFQEKLERCLSTSPISVLDLDNPEGFKLLAALQVGILARVTFSFSFDVLFCTFASGFYRLSA